MLRGRREAARLPANRIHALRAAEQGIEAAKYQARAVVYCFDHRLHGENSAEISETLSEVWKSSLGRNSDTPACDRCLEIGH